MFNDFTPLYSHPSLKGDILSEDVTLSPDPLNNAVATFLIYEGHSIVFPSYSLYASRSPDVRVDNIADILGRMAAQLRERMPFDFRKCTDFAKIYVPAADRDAVKDPFVHQLSDGGRRYVTQATVQVHKGD